MIKLFSISWMGILQIPSQETPCHKTCRFLVKQFFEYNLSEVILNKHLYAELPKGRPA